MQPPLFDLAPVYFVDCNVLMSLDGKHKTTSVFEYSQGQRTAVWATMERLCGENRFKVIEQVKAELAKYHPEAYETIRGWKKHRVAARTDTVIRLYQEITDRHPKMVRRFDADPADPWLVAWGRFWAARRAAILTDELRMKDASSSPANVRRKLRNGPPLPDLCDEYQVRTYCLEEFLLEECPEALNRGG